MDSDTKEHLIMSAFYEAPNELNYQLGNRTDPDKAISRLQSYIDHDIIDQHDLYSVFLKNMIDIRRITNCSTVLIQWFVEQTASMISEEDVLNHFIKNEIMIDDSSPIYFTYRNIIDNSTIMTTLSIRFARIIYSDDRFEEYLATLSIDDIISDTCYLGVIVTPFLKDHIINRIDKIKNVDTIFCAYKIIGPCDQIDEWIEDKISQNKYELLRDVISKLASGENIYMTTRIIDIYERITNTSFKLDSDKYMIYFSLLTWSTKSGLHIYSEYSTERLTNLYKKLYLFSQISMYILPIDLRDEYYELELRLNAMWETHRTFGEPTYVLDDEVDKLDLLLGNIMEFMDKTIF